MKVDMKIAFFRILLLVDLINIQVFFVGQEV